MSGIRRLMNQTATYWPLNATTPYDSYGDPAYTSTSPQLLTPGEDTGVRWEDKNEEFIDTKTGDQIQSRAVVWSASTAFVSGGYLFLGRSSSTTPESVTGADMIRNVSQVPDTKGKVILYKAFL